LARTQLIVRCKCRCCRLHHFPDLVLQMGGATVVERECCRLLLHHETLVFVEPDAEPVADGLEQPVIDAGTSDVAARIAPLETVLADSRKSAGSEQPVKIMQGASADKRQRAALALRGELQRVAQGGWNPHGIG